MDRMQSPLKDRLCRLRLAEPVSISVLIPHSEWVGREVYGRAEMNRQQSGTHQQPYPDFGGQDRGIGLRAVAAAILFQGDASNAGRPPKKEVPVPASVVT